ncbi:MAG: cation diffusion facilitator family transporter [Anaerolineales bacterium]|jgi:cobalt-zinc-cadmium efflux system protein
MGHSHTHEHGRGSGDNIRVALFLNLGFTLLELVGGYLTNSLAILSDAVHDLGDSISLGLAWYLDRYSHRGRDERFSYGYRRFSLLGALINTVILLVGSIAILSQAIPRLLNPQETNAPGMVLIAIVGVAVNGLAVIRLRGESNLNARVVSLHLLEDVLGWVAVLVVAIVLLFFDLDFLDPLLSILISIYILFNVVRNLRETLALFLQAVPVGVDVAQLEKDLGEIDEVCSVHHTHVWSLDGENHVLSTHVVVDDDLPRSSVIRLKQSIRQVLEAYDFRHITVEIEYGETDCAMLSAGSIFEISIDNQSSGSPSA